MLIEGKRPETVGTTETRQPPPILHSLGRQLEQIRREHLARNRSRLRTMAIEQQKCVELLTLAITRRILEEMNQGWEVSVANGNETQITEIVTRVWSR